MCGLKWEDGILCVNVRRLYGSLETPSLPERYQHVSGTLLEVFSENCGSVFCLFVNKLYELHERIIKLSYNSKSTAKVFRLLSSVPAMP